MLLQSGFVQEVAWSWSHGYRSRNKARITGLWETHRSGFNALRMPFKWQIQNLNRGKQDLQLKFKRTTACLTFSGADGSETAEMKVSLGQLFWMWMSHQPVCHFSAQECVSVRGLLVLVCSVRRRRRCVPLFAITAPPVTKQRLRNARGWTRLAARDLPIQFHRVNPPQGPGDGSRLKATLKNLTTNQTASI